MSKTEDLGLIPCPHEKPGKMMYIYNPRAREADRRTPSWPASLGHSEAPGSLGDHISANESRMTEGDS